MATNFPTSVDNFTNPTANDSLNLPSHSTQHANANDAIEAVEDYLLNGAGKPSLVLLNSTLLVAQSSVTVSNVFSNTYDFYRVEIGLKGSTSTDLFCRLASGGTPAGTLAYYAQKLTVSNTSVTASSAGANQFPIGPYGSSDNWLFNVELCFPASVQSKGMSSQGGKNDNLQIHAGTMNIAAAYDGFNIFCNSGNFTGIMSIFGYKK